MGTTFQTESDQNFIATPSTCYQTEAQSSESVANNNTKRNWSQYMASNNFNPVKQEETPFGFAKSNFQIKNENLNE